MTTAIDLFAGAGGFTAGATAAGLDVLWAANHWPEAVETHARNHAGTEHACQDLSQANFTLVPEHDVLLASPACQGHSRARGAERPHHDATRSTAWAVIACVEAREPAAVVVENVEEFMDWKLFPVWSEALHAYSYDVTTHVLDAADFGVAQHRRRMFLVASRSGPIHVETPTREQATARDIINLEDGRWSPIRKPGRSPNTLARIEAGRAAFGDTFVAPYYGSGSGKTGRSMDRPLGTVTTHDRWAVIRGDEMRMLTADEYRKAMGFREGYLLPGSKEKALHMLGNAVCPPVAEAVCAQVAASI